jgi:hypothetical protein
LSAAKPSTIEGRRDFRFKLPKVPEMAEHEKSWLAAAIDGEGTITLHWKRKRSVPTGKILITNNSKKFLDYAKMITRTGTTPRNNVEVNHTYGRFRIELIDCDFAPNSTVPNHKEAPSGDIVVGRMEHERKLEGSSTPKQPRGQERQSGRAHLSARSRTRGRFYACLDECNNTWRHRGGT